MERMTANDFWRWFSSEAAGLACADGQSVVERVGAKLNAFDPRIGIEVSDPAEQRELIITAWSQPDVFPVVQDLMAAAPREVPGWTIFALKPPRGFEFGIDVDGLRIDAGALRFDPLASPQAPMALGIRLYVTGAPPDDPRWSRAVPLILETGIGERALVQIGYLETAAGPPPDERATSVDQLLPYIQWHRKKHGLG